MSIPDHVRELENWLSKLRVSGAFLLDQDTWDRFGRAHASDEEIDERTARERQMTELRAVSIKALDQLVPVLRRDAPEAIVQWADAHDALLSRFIASTTATGPDAVAIGVAKQERGAWQAVKRGEQNYVDGNSFFIQFDRELYRQLFGIDA